MPPSSEFLPPLSSCGKICLYGRIASPKICLSNGFTLHPLQRIVGLFSEIRPAFPPPLETTESGVRCKNRSRFYLRQARQKSLQKVRVTSCCFRRKMCGIDVKLPSEVRIAPADGASLS